MIRRTWTTVTGTCALCVLSCSSKVETGSVIGPSDEKPGAGSVDSGAVLANCEPFCGQSGGASFATGSGGAFGAPSDGGLGVGVCAGEAHATEALPVDLYVMFDQSSSMGDLLPDGSGTWWSAAQAAVKSFVNDPRAAGMEVGIQYFPLNGVAPASCAAPYSTPDVELGLLPANAAAIGASIGAHQPTAFTPTGPALSGAIAHMKAWAASHPGRAPIVVLVTDGFPTECDPQQIVDVAAIAGTGFATVPPVRTFVVGFNLGQGGQNLAVISKAGGSGQPFLISGGDIGAAFSKALLGITNTPLQCTFDVPKPFDASQTVDPDLVDVRYTPSATRVTEEIPRLNNLGDCDLNQGQGWYFDSPNTPTKIEVCPGTCAKLAAGVIETIVGCKPGLGTTK